MIMVQEFIKKYNLCDKSESEWPQQNIQLLASQLHSSRTSLNERWERTIAALRKASSKISREISHQTKKKRLVYNGAKCQRVLAMRAFVVKHSLHTKSRADWPPMDELKTFIKALHWPKGSYKRKWQLDHAIDSLREIW